MVKTITTYEASDGSVFDNLDDAHAYEKKFGAPSRTLRFYGHSDDIIMVDNCYGINEDGEFYNSPLAVINHNTGEGFLVHVQYVKPGVWMVGLSPLDDDVPMPDWPLELLFDGYSALMELDVPAGTTVKEVANK